MNFLGSCRVCGRPIHNYIGLAQHLRFHSDPEHQALKSDWFAWKMQYRAVLRCRKCGGLWEITDKEERNQKRCPTCRALRESVGKRKYEAERPDKKPDPRKFFPHVGSKAKWDGLAERELVWGPGDNLCQEIATGLGEGLKVGQILQKVGVSYKLFKQIAEFLFGVEEYRAWAKGRIRERTVAMARKAHEKYRNMSPEEKAEFFSKFKRGSSLERVLADQLRSAGLSDFIMNVWQSVPVRGVMEPREADIKLAVGDGRKIVILCDGLAFHGPGTIYGNPADRIREDAATAEAYFQSGYSVLRVSETEVKNGVALAAVQTALEKLKSTVRYYRNWCPSEERVV